MRVVQILDSGISIECLKKLNVQVVNLLLLNFNSPFITLFVTLEMFSLCQVAQC